MIFSYATAVMRTQLVGPCVVRAIVMATSLINVSSDQMYQIHWTVVCVLVVLGPFVSSGITSMVGASMCFIRTQQYPYHELPGKIQFFHEQIVEKQKELHL